MLNLSTVTGMRRVLFLAAALLAGSAAGAAAPDSAVTPWLGKEITITVSTLGDHIPLGGKFTLIYDGEDDVVRICARSVPAKRATWRMDVALHTAAASRDAVELHDVIVFLLAPKGAQKEVALLLDSPSRVTHNGIIHGTS